jgi:hypothetical protein
MPTDKYTKFILTVIACGLLALAISPSDTQVAPRETAPSPNTTVARAFERIQPNEEAGASEWILPNEEAGASEKLYLCNARGCIEVAPCDRRPHPYPEACVDPTGDRPTTTPP